MVATITSNGRPLLVMVNLQKNTSAHFSLAHLAVLPNLMYVYIYTIICEGFCTEHHGIDSHNLKHKVSRPSCNGMYQCNHLYIHTDCAAVQWLGS